MINSLLKKLAHTTGTEEMANKLLFLSRRTARNIKGTDRKIIARYFELTPHGRKLHIGCGGHTLPGWLNSDYHTKSQEIIHLDATRAFPFADGEFEYIFSEHMIEHINFPDGLRMLQEAFRVLKPGGKIRIATPDLSFFIGLFSQDKTDLQNAYLQHSTNKYVSHAPFVDATFVLNNYVRAWGHQFIYSEKVLHHALQQAGFENITRFDASESRDSALSHLERVERKPDGMIKAETLVLEATRP